VELEGRSPLAIVRASGGDCSARPASPRRHLVRRSSQHLPARQWVTLAMATLVLCVTPSLSEAQDRFGINVFGVAAHYGSPFYVDDNGVIRRYQWLEPGISFEYVAHETTRQRFSFEAGGYRDSELRRNLLAGIAWRWRLTPALDVGAAAVVWTSPSYPVPFGILPLVSYRVHHVGINGIILPWRGYGAFASFASIYF
jgi:hypothetical protein